MPCLPTRLLPAGSPSLRKIPQLQGVDLRSYSKIIQALFGDAGLQAQDAAVGRRNRWSWIWVDIWRRHSQRLSPVVSSCCPAVLSPESTWRTALLDDLRNSGSSSHLHPNAPWHNLHLFLPKLLCWPQLFSFAWGPGSLNKSELPALQGTLQGVAQVVPPPSCTALWPPCGLAFLRLHEEGVATPRCAGAC